MLITSLDQLASLSAVEIENYRYEGCRLKNWSYNNMEKKVKLETKSGFNLFRVDLPINLEFAPMNDEWIGSPDWIECTFG
jgi:hypothetical protein